MDDKSAPCHLKQTIDGNMSPLISAVMFAAGVFGNVAALVLLEIRRRRESGRGGGGGHRRTLFNVLVTSLVATDLTGTCLVSPLVQVSYSLNTTLVAMSGGGASPHAACAYFGFSMTFFSLATMSILFLMALERCLAIGHPYFYGRCVTKKCAYVTLPALFCVCALFCCLPLVADFGEYVQYCPGTWCFLDMNPAKGQHRAYANLYASVMLALVLAIVACNGSVVYHLVNMYRRRRRNGGSVTARFKRERGVAVSLAEEVEHLILLVFMTIIFIICTMPLVVRERGGDERGTEVEKVQTRSLGVQWSWRGDRRQAEREAEEVYRGSLGDAGGEQSSLISNGSTARLSRTPRYPLTLLFC